MQPFKLNYQLYVCVIQQVQSIKTKYNKLLEEQYNLYKKLQKKDEDENKKLKAEINKLTEKLTLAKQVEKLNEDEDIIPLKKDAEVCMYVASIMVNCVCVCVCVYIVAS